MTNQNNGSVAGQNPNRELDNYVTRVFYDGVASLRTPVRSVEEELDILGRTRYKGRKLELMYDAGCD